ncbi:torsin-1A-like [Seriola lalandi dorsalis]|uniref:torsin-1A-like n=1 Tax=Seriola lalandi dorsalis TaxID=1841481 RepID=UPI000C6F6286|nr:torsin-1A-like [Seriola lalandi dorsalis]XP_056259748.1 torsin-1A-like [Seriola aureovittata]
MKPRKQHVLLLWMLVCSGGAEASEYVGAAAVVGVVATLAGVVYRCQNIYCYYECCGRQWISFNWQGFADDLDLKLFGQHIAAHSILKAVEGFMSNANPKKPLVLSLHGWTGTGKNFASQLIAENIYKEGIKSRFFHVFSATHHFPHPKQHLQTYKHQLKQWLKEGIADCERSMFIFDEVDKMDPKLMDSIKPYLDYYDKLDGVSYQKAIFIFLSNEGGDVIAQTALDFKKAGRRREDIKLVDLETPLSRSLFDNTQSGFFRSSLISKKMVDYFIPFLPLEYNHVIQCVKAEMKTRGILPNPDVAERLAKDLVYFPKSERIFSTIGCKTVDKKLHFYL